MKREPVLTPYQCKPHPIRDRTVKEKNWFYVAPDTCSFHNAELHGRGVQISTKQLIGALKRAGLVRP